MTKDLTSTSSHRVNRQHFSVADLNDADDAESYWLTRTPLERLEHIEYLRFINYGDPAERRFQRFFEVVDFPPS